MRRREFVQLLGGAALWSSGAVAQTNDKKRIIGLISGFSEAEMRPLVEAFRTRMQELGWIDGQNITVVVRTTSGDYKRLETEADSLAAASADVIVALGTPSLLAARRNSKTTPVVFAQVADPVGQKFIDSLARPGGNMTGLTNFEFAFGGKWLELLRELDPTTSHVTVITNPANANTAQFVTAITTAGNSMKVAIQNALVRNVAEIENAIETCSKQPGGSLIILPDSLAIVHRKLIIELAARYRLPAVYPFRIFAEDGGLLSYETNFKAVYSRAAEYVDKILRGTSAANLPVEAPNKLELVVNMKTAKALGLTMPRSLQIAADELIE